MPPAAGRPTGRDVARLAGVSQSTVSLVLSGKAAGRISADLRARVHDAARQLDYRPHRAASSLREGLARAIGIFVPDVGDVGVARVLRGAARAAHREDFMIVLVGAGAARPAPAPVLDGTLVFGDGLTTVALVTDLAGAHPSIAVDVDGGAGLALDHLVALGHRRLAHLTAGARGDARWRELVAGSAPAGTHTSVRRCDREPNAACRAAAALLAERPRPTALFCDSDLLALAALVAARRAGIRVPEDLSIVGFAGAPASHALTPALTSVEAPGDELGAIALRTMVDVVTARSAPTNRRLPMTLTRRASTAPPGGRAYAAVDGRPMVT